MVSKEYSTSQCKCVIASSGVSVPLVQWFPTGKEFLPREEFPMISGGISTL